MRPTGSFLRAGRLLQHLPDKVPRLLMVWDGVEIATLGRDLRLWLVGCSDAACVCVCVCIIVFSVTEAV